MSTRDDLAARDEIMLRVKEALSGLPPDQEKFAGLLLQAMEEFLKMPPVPAGMDPIEAIRRDLRRLREKPSE
jgi:hypothetical protein